MNLDADLPGPFCSKYLYGLSMYDDSTSPAVAESEKVPYPYILGNLDAFQAAVYLHRKLVSFLHQPHGIF
jgi:hypothetical protein